MGEAVRASVKAPETKKENQFSKVQKGNFYQPVSSSVEQILFLQRTVGNQVVQRLMKSGALQAKLRIGAPGDVYEQEADRVAEQVMRMPQPQAVSSGTPSIQRACPKCEEKKLQRKPVEEEEELQAKATSSSIYEVNPDIESHIQSLKGGGKPLSENERAFFELRFGRDFSTHVIQQASMKGINMVAEQAEEFQDITREQKYRPKSLSVFSDSVSSGILLQCQAAPPQNKNPAPAPPTTLPSASLGLLWPVDASGSKVWSCYGIRTAGFHPGIDISQGEGKSVYAVAAGTVIIAGPAGGYGPNFVAIKHSDTLITSYGHMKSKLVKVSDQVTRGQQIGTVGSMGLSTGPHLHFNVTTGANPPDKYNGNVDPLQNGLSIPADVDNPKNCT